MKTKGTLLKIAALTACVEHEEIAILPQFLIDAL